MNRNDFRNPLIQSGILLLVVFIFISIVANAPADGFIASVYALVSGLVRGLLFVIALSIGLLFSIAVLVGIFLLAASFHSVDKARVIWEHLKASFVTFYCRFSERLRSAVKKKQSPLSEKASSPSALKGPDSWEAPAAQQQDRLHIEKKITTLEAQVSRLETTIQTTEEHLAAIQTRLQEERASAGAAGDRLDELEASAGELGSAVQLQEQKIASVEAGLATLAESIKPDIDSLSREIAELHEKTSVPEVVSGILAYIDTQEERETLTAKAEEAVSRGMTYAQTDEFFKKSLPVRVHKALSEHPRLTKDFIRSIKKKFE
jgi:polyhydroxyalkanoate synthesis regulator phasin